jgi:monovalent cation/proton antiporter MnhG/PhaG subunit
VNLANIAVQASLAIMVVFTAISCCALLLFTDLFQRLHYLSLVTTVSTMALLIAVVIKEGAGQATIKAILTFIVLLLINSVLTHATARAARVREFGDWAPNAEQDVRPVEGTK